MSWIQLLKRSPINLRKLLLVPKDYNPKGLGLFLSSYCKLYNINKDSQSLSKIHLLTERIIGLISDGYSGACWGYNFDWQARAFFQPKYMPTVVVTSYVANAILDAFDITGDKNLLEIAKSSCDFVLKDLNRSYDEYGNYAYSYSPVDESVVFNASLLGSRLLSRVYSYTKERYLHFCIT